MTVRYRAAVVGVVYGKALRLASHASKHLLPGSIRWICFLTTPI